MAECQCQQQESARASREAHPRSRLSSRARTSESSGSNRDDAQLGNDRKGKVHDEVSGSAVRKEIRVPREVETKHDEPHPAPYYARLTAAGRRDFTREPPPWSGNTRARRCHWKGVDGWGLKGSSTYYADTHAHC